MSNVSKSLFALDQFGNAANPVLTASGASLTAMDGTAKPVSVTAGTILRMENRGDGSAPGNMYYSWDGNTPGSTDPASIRLGATMIDYWTVPASVTTLKVIGANNTGNLHIMPVAQP